MAVQSQWGEHSILTFEYYFKMNTYNIAHKGAYLIPSSDNSPSCPWNKEEIFMKKHEMAPAANPRLNSRATECMRVDDSPWDDRRGDTGTPGAYFCLLCLLLFFFLF